MQTLLSDDPRATNYSSSPRLSHHEPDAITTSCSNVYLCIACTYCPTAVARIRRWRTLGSGEKADTIRHSPPGSIRGVQWFTAVNYFTGVILFEASSVLPSRQTGVRGQQINTTSKLGLPSNNLLRNQHGETRDTRQTQEPTKAPQQEEKATHTRRNRHDHNGKQDLIN